MNKTLTILLGVVGVLVVTLLVLVAGDSKAGGITFTGRGVVNPGGDATNSVDVYWTHVPASVDRIRGLRSDVNTATAEKYIWEVSKGQLIKRRTTSQPTPGKEVVIKGTLRENDDRVTASWMVQNHRKFTIEGKVQGRILDTNKTDQGYLTVNVTSSILGGIKAKTKFKETSIKGKDLRIRVDGHTAVTALGKSKNFDEVSASQQKVIVEGEVLNVDDWQASKVNETN